MHAKVGDFAIRNMAGIKMKLRVTEITDKLILCGEADAGWAFDRATGAEIDEELGWGPYPKMTGSFIEGFEKGE